VLIIGEDEFAKGVVAVKDLHAKSQQFITTDNLAEFFKQSKNA